MKRRTRVTWRSRGGRTAGSIAIAVAIVMAGALCPAQAATSTAYVSVSSEGGLATAISADNVADIQTTNIGVGNDPLYLAANPSGTRVYVPNRNSNTVSVIDTSTNTEIGTVDDPDGTFQEPYAVAVSPDGKEAWVANNFGGTVSIIDTSTNAVTGTIPDAGGCFYNATGVVFNPVLSRHEAYVVAEPGGKAVCVVSTSAPYDVLDTVYLDSGIYNAEYAVVTPDGSKVYVTGDAVSRIDTQTRGAISFYPYSLSTVSYLAVSNDGTKVYAAGNDSYLEIIDTSYDDFTDNYIYFSSASTINAVTVVPGTDLGLVTDNYWNEVYAFDTSTDAEITSGAIPVSLDGTPAAIIAVTRAEATPPPALTLQNGGLGAGWLGSCGMVVGRDGRGPASPGESAGMIALYFALLLLPVGILKLVHRRKRLPVEKTGIIALFIVASMLIAASAHAERLVAPKAQRFHPTTDGQGALTVDTDRTLCPGQFNFGLTLSGAKKPLDMGDIRLLKVEKVVVDELYTADLTAAYGLTPDITLGLDIPYDYSRDNLNYADYKLNGAPGVRGDVTHLGDIRVNAKYRLLSAPKYGVALIPFANFATGNRDYLLSEGKFGFGMKVAAHYDATKVLTLYGNLGAEHIGDVAAPRDGDNYYLPWIQYGVGGAYRLPWRKDSIVAEINGETSWASPYSHTTLSPFEVLAAYRTEVAPGWTLQAGGGGGLNKGMGAPQWRAILGVAYKM